MEGFRETNAPDETQTDGKSHSRESNTNILGTANNTQAAEQKKSAAEIL